MQATIFQENGITYYQIQVQNLLSEQQIQELQAQAYKEHLINAYDKAYQEAIEKVQTVSPKEAAALLGLSTEKIHEMAEHPKGHPRRLHCIQHEDKRYRRFRLSELERWAETSEDEHILERIYNFEHKQKRSKK